jgi:hypothetical protein
MNTLVLKVYKLAIFTLTSDQRYLYLLDYANIDYLLTKTITWEVFSGKKAFDILTLTETGR